MFCSLRHCDLLTLVAFFTCLLVFTGSSRGEQGTDTDKQLLNHLITEYFSSWSRADMATYRSCFHPKASIYFIDSSGNPHLTMLEEFIAGQERAHRAAREGLFEKPTHTALEVRGRMARAAVLWELHQGRASFTGTDYFTFIKTETGWKIVSLVFEQDKK